MPTVLHRPGHTNFPNFSTNDGLSLVHLAPVGRSCLAS